MQVRIESKLYGCNHCGLPAQANDRKVPLLLLHIPGESEVAAGQNVTAPANNECRGNLLVAITKMQFAAR
jgi:hypothetical protein